MDKQIYLSISERIHQEVPDFKWIDYDWGQLNGQERPPVAFPCILIDIAFTDCKTLGEGPGATEQLVTASISLKLAFEVLVGSQVSVDGDKRAIALKPLDTIEMLHASLQGWNGEGIFAALSRKRGNAIPPRNNLKIYNIVYETRFINTPD